jgi:hypothetical protein
MSTKKINNKSSRKTKKNKFMNNHKFTIVFLKNLWGGKNDPNKLKNVLSGLNEHADNSKHQHITIKDEKDTIRDVKKICSDLSICIAFGKEIDKINKYFDNFINVQYITQFKRVNQSSANGFVYIIKYTKHKYSAHAVMKSTLTKSSDNLAYEYLVGEFLNKYNKIFPCFCETYGLLHYLSEAKWQSFKNDNIKNKTVLKNSFVVLKDLTVNNLEYTCSNSKHLILMTEYIKNTETIEKNLNNSAFVYNELIYVLYQIYLPLSMLSNKFTHYDLHIGNVLLFTPVKNSYIHYHYHINNKTISFKSPYIVKIIDYGRSYFNDQETGVSSKTIYNQLCKLKTCNPNCGYTKGYVSLSSTQGYSDYNIISVIPNQSQDIRLFSGIFEDIIKNLTENKKKMYEDKYLIAKILHSLQSKIIYGVGIPNKAEKQYGTVEDLKKDKNIRNIHDVRNVLESIIDTDATHVNNELINETRKKLGDLHVYTDKSMDYVPYKSIKK